MVLSVNLKFFVLCIVWCVNKGEEEKGRERERENGEREGGSIDERNVTRERESTYLGVKTNDTARESKQNCVMTLLYIGKDRRNVKKRRNRRITKAVWILLLVTWEYKFSFVLNRRHIYTTCEDTLLCLYFAILLFLCYDVDGSVIFPLFKIDDTHLRHWISYIQYILCKREAKCSEIYT